MDAFGLAPDAVARAVAFAIEQPHDVEIGDITIRPTVQGSGRLPKWQGACRSGVTAGSLVVGGRQAEACAPNTRWMSGFICCSCCPQ
jgi:hypothetical protein